jgi:hypothetical protein
MIFLGLFNANLYFQETGSKIRPANNCYVQNQTESASEHDSTGSVALRGDPSRSHQITVLRMHIQGETYHDHTIPRSDS